MLVAAVLALVVASWYPFRPEMPWELRRGPLAASATEARFDGSSVLVSRPDLDWVADAASTGSLRLALDLRTDRAEQSGPARLLSISRDTLAADLMVGQEGDDLVVRVRRPGSDASGHPAFRVPDVFATDQVGRWRHLVLDVGGGRLVAELDGAVVLDQPVTLAGWDPSYRLALGDEAVGQRGWVGELRHVEVSTPGHTVDVLASGTLDGGSGWIWRDRVRNLTSLSSADPLALIVARFAAFVPVGLGLGLLLRRRWAVAAMVGIALGLVAGKLFVLGRHPRLGDAIVCVVGGLAGILLAARLERTQPRSSGGGGPGVLTAPGEVEVAQPATEARNRGPASTNHSSISEGSSSSSLSST
jgi:hypothetical protein